MARTRAPLTEKEERILLQSQLMGLGTDSMIKIANRLRAIEKERNERAVIDEDVAGNAWTKTPKGWIVHSRDKYVFELTKHKITRGWHSTTIYWNVSITKPGTRFVQRNLKDRPTHISHDTIARLCPNNSKELLAVLRYINHTVKWDLT